MYTAQSLVALRCCTSSHLFVTVPKKLGGVVIRVVVVTTLVGRVCRAQKHKAVQLSLLTGDDDCCFGFSIPPGVGGGCA